MLDDSRPPFYRWFSGAELNTCRNASTIDDPAILGEIETALKEIGYARHKGSAGPQ
jgi:hypothetical protein